MRLAAAALLLAGAACARAFAMPTEVRAEYELRNLGLAIARVTESFVRQGDRYAIESVTVSQGVLKLILDDRLTVTSRGRVEGPWLRPEAFDQVRERDPKRDIHAVFDYAAGQIRSTYKGEQLTMPLPPNTQDRLSLMYQLMGAAARSPGSSIPMTNGRKVESYAYRLVGEERIETRLGELATLHCQRVPQSAKDNRVDVWLARDRHNFPVRVVFDDPDGLRVEQHIVALTVR